MSSQASQDPELQRAEEQRWIKAAQKEVRHFRPLYERYHSRILRFVFNKVGEEEQAADITQQVFLKAMLHLGRYKITSVPFEAWLYRIAVNETISFFRKSKRARQVLLDERAVEKLNDDLDEPDLELLSAQLRTAIEQLSLEEVQLLELRYYEERAFREIGHILNISENNARVKLFRITKKLRNYCAELS